jgi:hypothetical protein
MTRVHIEISDDVIGQHFGHHQRFAARGDLPWQFEVMDVPVSSLFCMYDDPGLNSRNQRGLMGAAGLSPTGYAGVSIVTLAHLVQASLTDGTADVQNEALAKVLRFRDAGAAFILSRPEPIAFTRSPDGRNFVREGTHRSVALALLGVDSVRGLDFESGIRCQNRE